MSLRRMDSKNNGKCKENDPVTKPIINSTIKPVLRNQNYEDLENAAKQVKVDNENIAADNTDVYKPLSSNMNDPLKKRTYFSNKVSPKHMLHTNQKTFQHHHGDDKEYPDTEYNYDEYDDLGLYYDHI